MSRLSLMSGAVAALCAFAACGPAAAQSYATFSVRDGTSTNPYAINAGGVVTGAYCGTDWCDGFVRTAGG